MPSEPLHMFDPRTTIQLQGFSARAATTTIHDATETGFQITGVFQAAEDFANVQLFSAYDYYNHLRLKPLPVTVLSGVTLPFDMQALPVNSEEGNVRPDCVKYPLVGWDKLTITTGNGESYEVPLMAHCSVLSGGFTPGSFHIALEDKKAEDLDTLVGGPRPALTGAAYIYFMGTRSSCTSPEAFAFCNLEPLARLHLQSLRQARERHCALQTAACPRRVDCSGAWERNTLGKLRPLCRAPRGAWIETERTLPKRPGGSQRDSSLVYAPSASNRLSASGNGNLRGASPASPYTSRPEITPSCANNKMPLRASSPPNTKSARTRNPPEG